MSFYAVADVMRLRDLHPLKKLLLIVLANYADDDLSCRPSQATLAADTGMCERSVRAHLAELEESGMISRTQRQRPDGSRASDRFTINCATAEKAPKSKRQEIPGGGASRSGLATLEPTTDTNSEAKASAELFDFPVPEPEPQPKDPNGKAWEEAVVVLTSQGKLSKERAKALFGKILRDYRLEARDLLGPLGEIVNNGSQDPQSYLVAAARAREKRKGEPEQAKRQTWI